MDSNLERYLTKLLDYATQRMPLGIPL